MTMGKPSEWTDEIAFELRRLWDGRNHTASQVALALNAEFGINITRNAVIGKVCRMGLESHKKEFKARKPKLLPRQKRRKHRINLASGVVTETFESVATVSSLDPDEIPIEQRKQLLDLESDDCRWPYGDPGNPGFFFCGGLTDGNHPYCPYHHKVSKAKSVTLDRAEIERQKNRGRWVADHSRRRVA